MPLLRFGGLSRAVGEITQRVLTEYLRRLERDGYLTRRVAAGPPLAVYYALTPLGYQLLTPLKSLVRWAGENHDHIAKSCKAVASPDYLDRAGHPETPEDLTRHACITMGRAPVASDE